MECTTAVPSLAAIVQAVEVWTFRSGAYSRQGPPSCTKYLDEPPTPEILQEEGGRLGTIADAISGGWKLLGPPVRDREHSWLWFFRWVGE